MRGSLGLRLLAIASAAVMFLLGIILIPAKMRTIRIQGGEEAAQLAEFLRLTEVWAILMMGSMLALAAAAIQLALA